MSFSYTPGLHHVGCYQVSGYPNVANGTLGGALDVLDYDFVTKEIVVMNTHGSNDLYVLFNSASPVESKFKIAAGAQHTFDVKTRRVYISGASGTTYSACASLTTIGKERITEHEGQGITTAPTVTT